MITKKYYKPGQTVTLYHFRKDKFFKGILYLTDSEFPHGMWEPRNITLPDNLWERLAKMFLGLAVIGFIVVFFPLIYSGVSYRLTALVQNLDIIKKPQIIPAVADIPISEEFFLEIPKISLISTIVPNVDSSNEQQYLEKLKQGVAHAKGSYFPGDSGPIVLFSHSTDALANILQYNAKFYALKDLEAGDEIKINFKGKPYIYKVTDKKIINPSQLDAIRQSNSKLILTTCWPPGTDWQRMVVFAN